MLNPKALKSLYEAGKQIDNIMARMRQTDFYRYPQAADNLLWAISKLHIAVMLAEERRKPNVQASSQEETKEINKED